MDITNQEVFDWYDDRFSFFKTAFGRLGREGVTAEAVKQRFMVVEL